MHYHTEKLAAFKAQRNCFKKLLKIQTTMQCAAMNAKTLFMKPKGANDTKSYMYVKRSALANMTAVCMKSVMWNIKLGEAFTEVEAEMYAVSRYPGAKAQWVKWKQMMNNVAKCDMKFNTLLNLVVYKIFKEGGLWDQGQKFEKAELVALKAKLKEVNPWDMNMKLPVNCTNTTCPQVRAWVTARGVSDDAGDMKNFQVADSNNVTLRDVDLNLDQFEEYEKAIDSPENEKKAEQFTKALLMALDGDLTLLQKLLNGTLPMRRMLAEDTVMIMEVDDTQAGSLDAGNDDQLADDQLKDVDEIDQTPPTTDIEAVDNV